MASIWFQCVVPMPLADGPMMTWPTLSPRPSLLLSATVTRRDRSWEERDMGAGDQGAVLEALHGSWAPVGCQVWLPDSSPLTCLTPQPPSATSIHGGSTMRPRFKCQPQLFLAV